MLQGEGTEVCHCRLFKSIRSHLVTMLLLSFAYNEFQELCKFDRAVERSVWGLLKYMYHSLFAGANYTYIINVALLHSMHANILM